MSITKTLFAVLVSLALVLPFPANAQPEFTPSTSKGADPPGRSVRMALGGLGGGLIGLGVGAGLGANLARNDQHEFSGLAEAFYIGSTIGAIGLGAGVHIGNERRGNSLAVMGSSLAVGAVGVATMVETDEPIVLPVTIVAQLLVAIAVEKHTARDDSRQAVAPRTRSTTVDLWTPSGAAGFLVRHSF